MNSQCKRLSLVLLSFTHSFTIFSFFRLKINNIIDSNVSVITILVRIEVSSQV